MSAVIVFCIGLVIALGGGFFVAGFVDVVQRMHGLEPRPQQGRMDAFFLGVFERLLTFFLVYYSVDETAVVLTAWVAAKMLLNWQRDPTGMPQEEWRTRGFIALMANVVSLAFGVMGGLLANGTIPLP